MNEQKPQELTAEDIQKYSKKSLPQLRKKAQEVFNTYIREIRDKDCFCISCGSPNGNQCGHYYSRGSHPGLALVELNVGKQCTHCNLYNHGALIGFRAGLIKKWGEDEVKKLDDMAQSLKRQVWKPDRFFFIEKIIHYKALLSKK